MKNLLLPGINPKTVDWLQSLATKLSLEQASLLSHSYTFHEDSDAEKNLDDEIDNLPKGSYDLIIAKSFGCLVTLQALEEKRIQCNRALLFGIPLKIFSDTGFDVTAMEQLKNRSILTVQQKNDPFGNARKLEHYEPACLLTIEGGDHQYDDLSLYLDQVSDWLRQS